MSTSPFQYKLENIIRYEITGDFRYGEHFVEFQIMIQATKLTGLRLHLDLTKVDYMDSDTYKLIHKLEKDNQIITWEPNSYVRIRYLDYTAGRV